MRGLLIGLALVLLALQWPLWLGEGSWRDVRDLREQVAQQQAANAELEQRNQALEAEVRDLRGGTAAVEERARRDLGMIREDEIFFFVVGEDEPTRLQVEPLPGPAGETDPGPDAQVPEDAEPATDTLPPEDPFDG
ncbi:MULTISPECIES: cell division protein FtsB [unclassified Thioalkalivibrio]|uniref:cell division protein FtsB n=1 Tax=unclassified Thioalkalivibrio TaxID=2621013 RepID=UPI000372C378|nr:MULTISPECIES: cell division protein FtsB [unclassified Thioalkalivibrio]